MALHDHHQRSGSPMFTPSLSCATNKVTSFLLENEICYLNPKKYISIGHQLST